MKNLNGIEYLVGNKNISKRSLLPYDNNICDFLGDLSDELNSNSESKNYPDIKAFAFWCRKKNCDVFVEKFCDVENVYFISIFFIFQANISPGIQK